MRRRVTVCEWLDALAFVLLQIVLGICAFVFFLPTIIRIWIDAGFRFPDEDDDEP